ncbi:MAG TPA: SIMPL domain-containing protein [Candidatus Binatia bacterium]|nr:SIMPL domain-containing protein [Candidatus Binatia bacterium]
MRTAAAIFFIVFFPAVAHVQEADKKPRVPTVTVSAEALVTVEPDQAEIDIGVVAEAKTAAQAAKDNAARLAAVIAEVKKIIKTGDQTKTVGYSVTPNYRTPNPREGGKPEIVGYTATNVVQVKMASIQDVGRLIDAATAAGANRIQRLVFTLKDQDAAQRDALRQATAKARTKAEDVARALNVKFVRVMSVTENERSYRPFARERADMLGAAVQQQAPTPIESGSVEVRSSVTLEAEVTGQ